MTFWRLPHERCWPTSRTSVRSLFWHRAVIYDAFTDSHCLGLQQDFYLTMRLSPPGCTDTSQSPHSPSYPSTSGAKRWIENKQLRVRSSCANDINQSPCGPSRTRLTNQAASSIIYHSNQWFCCWSERGQELMKGKAQSVFQFLASFLTLFGRIVQYLTEIYFDGLSSLPNISEGFGN